ncbi:unnamed protein product [Closterium sp. Naga37s-1]|nr:unnamed protein product [Closterium sp. Naga37s-1]
MNGGPVCCVWFWWITARPSLPSFSPPSSLLPVMLALQHGVSERRAGVLRVALVDHCLLRSHCPHSFPPTTSRAYHVWCWACSTAYLNGGPVCCVWFWWITAFFAHLLALSFAEIASSFPTAGSLYFWAAALAGPKYGPFAAWITGWLEFVGVSVGVGGVAFGGIQQIMSLVLLATGHLTTACLSPRIPSPPTPRVMSLFLSRLKNPSSPRFPPSPVSRPSTTACLSPLVPSPPTPHLSFSPISSGAVRTSYLPLFPPSLPPITLSAPLPPFPGPPVGANGGGCDSLHYLQFLSCVAFILCVPLPHVSRFPLFPQEAPTAADTTSCITSCSFCRVWRSFSSVLYPSIPTASPPGGTNGGGGGYDFPHYLQFLACVTLILLCAVRLSLLSPLPPFPRWRQRGGISFPALPAVPVVCGAHSGLCSNQRASHQARGANSGSRDSAAGEG